MRLLLGRLVQVVRARCLIVRECLRVGQALSSQVAILGRLDGIALRGMQLGLQVRGGLLLGRDPPAEPLLLRGRRRLSFGEAIAQGGLLLSGGVLLRGDFRLQGMLLLGSRYLLAGNRSFQVLLSGAGGLVVLRHAVPETILLFVGGLLLRCHLVVEIGLGHAGSLVVGGNRVLQVAFRTQCRLLFGSQLLLHPCLGAVRLLLLLCQAHLEVGLLVFGCLFLLLCQCLL
mmetsp:Transcript_143997/g.365500  ORF Transcript_143997/g.365500 Transcript_143997/m.365500 type:complete len:229 (-) Transcript_143997:1212-1898(-)